MSMRPDPTILALERYFASDGEFAEILLHYAASFVWSSLEKSLKHARCLRLRRIPGRDAWSNDMASSTEAAVFV